MYRACCRINLWSIFLIFFVFLYQTESFFDRILGLDRNEDAEAEIDLVRIDQGDATLQDAGFLESPDAVPTGIAREADTLAHALDSDWPEGDGDYPELGVILGYPKDRPVTLMLAGEPISVGSLRVVAVEKSKDGQTLRLQLANPNNDTWLVRSQGGVELEEFVNGFDTHYQAERTKLLSSNWWLVRYKS